MINKILSVLSDATKAVAYAVAGVLALFLALAGVQHFATSPLESSIVKVTNNEGTGGGTGWVTKTSSGTRVIVTNHHVCQVSNGEYIRIEQDSGKHSMKRILNSDPNRDLCVIEGVDAPTLKLASQSARRFDPVTVYGHPLLNPTTPSYGQYVSDIIAPIGFSPNADGECEAGELMAAPEMPGPRQPPNFAQPALYAANPTFFFGPVCLLYMELSYTTATIYPGNSGSPVTNADGDVVGVMNSANPEDNRGNFIPLEYVRAVLED